MDLRASIDLANHLRHAGCHAAADAVVNGLFHLPPDPADEIPAGNICEDEDTSAEPFAHVSERETVY